MQDQLDLQILERVSEGHFDLVLPFSVHHKDIEREYRNRGFLVRTNDDSTTISWKNPDLNKMIKPNKKVYGIFTAQQVYYVLTIGKDLRRLTNVDVYQRLIREDKITETYGMQNIAVFNLYHDAIQKAIDEGYTVVVNEYGVISSNKNLDFDVNECREVSNGGGTCDVTNDVVRISTLASTISTDQNNKLVLGEDGKLYVEKALTETEW